MSETEFSVGKNCGVTFAGIKPSSLVSVKKEGASDLKTLSVSFKKKGISFRVLKETEDRLVVLVYDEKRLNEVLKSVARQWAANSLRTANSNRFSKVSRAN